MTFQGQLAVVASHQAAVAAAAVVQELPPQPQSSASSSQQESSALPYPIDAPSAPVYPGLAHFMGLELTEDVIRANMPEYLPGGSSNPLATAVAVPQQVNIHSASYFEISSFLSPFLFGF